MGDDDGGGGGDDDDGVAVCFCDVGEQAPLVRMPGWQGGAAASGPPSLGI